MTRDPLKELKLHKYRPLLQPRALRDCPAALCDADGHPLWAPREEDARAVAAACVRIFERGFGWDSEDETRRVELDGTETLFYRPVPAAGGPLAWLVLLVPAAQRATGATDLDAVDDILRGVTACLAEEHRLNGELYGLAEELSHRYEELNMLYSLREGVPEEGDRSVQRFLDGFAELIDVDVAAFVTVGRTLPIHATNLSRPIPNLDLVLVALRGDLFRFVQASRKILVLNAEDDPRRAFVLTNMPFKMLACPLGDTGTVDHMLVLLRHTQRPDFSNSDRSLARVVTDQVGLMLRNQSMMGRLKRFGEQTAGALIEALEAKDPYTRGHSERVQIVSIELGRALGFQPPELEDLFWGSIFHDVGKLGVPDAILCKPGRLTADEYDFIKIHPERSYEILKHVEYLRQDALHGARHHHERFDGLGYPHGLSGRAIPLQARIIAVADTYDAVTSSRSYRAGRSHDEAMAVIREAAGTQLDPQIVARLEELCTDGPRWPARGSLETLVGDG